MHESEVLLCRMPSKVAPILKIYTRLRVHMSSRENDFEELHSKFHKSAVHSTYQQKTTFLGRKGSILSSIKKLNGTESQRTPKKNAIELY